MAGAEASPPAWAAGKTAAVVLVWVVLGFFWLGVVVLLGDLIHPAIGPIWLTSAVVLAFVVGWWIVRARRDPRAVAALACWWFAASIVGPVALVVTLPWLRGFRLRSLAWITFAVSGQSEGGERPRDWKQLGDAASANIAYLERITGGDGAPPTINPSRRERCAGVTLFLVVTACWVVGPVLLSAWSSLFLIAAVFSALSVVVTGYLFGEISVALWLGWVPAATVIAIGFVSAPTPAGVNPGHDLGTRDALLYVAAPLLILGWAVYFFPLIAVGVFLRRRNVKGPAPALPLDSI